MTSISSRFTYISIISILLTACAGNGNHTGSTTCSPAQGYYCVAKGDTLSRIARRFNMNVHELKTLNNLRSDTIHVAQRLHINSDNNHQKTTHSAAIPSLQWPVQGNVFKTYSNSNRGIDIAAPAGTTVKAAADGQVIYAGSGIRGYGQLLLLRHNNGIITAYANNDRLLVSEKTRVKAGQAIATVGNSGRSDGETALHFELRINGTAINPLPYLPDKP
ncbi:MAG: peptidoglycan DD-metalloendopeptidase family protein [Alysiella sp.]|uniref:peptidoglycan DD-metalloendopeptidase family protein n=1 Tax=Alysiella sp. TaxID=1872483 RepID=UPI0026DAD578|nr:peptidoglycan DD-metalloendopeptidase family protein [Alysiella sp.]MDO4433849.1 peptidoglycan DD-metalloendopeptidase family protein [Alysiella sp.]